MSTFNPKVSIVIPVYNGANYMAEAIDSALNQTYKNVEVIVINDGSTDNGETDRIAKSYGNKIRYFYKSNGGVATALNLGVEKMTGDYFSWLSHDDKYKPEKIQVQIEELAKLNDKKTLLFGGYQNFSDEGGVFETMDFAQIYKKEELETHLFPVLHLALNGCTMLIHKSHFERVGLFDPGLPTTQDYDLWFRMFRHQKGRCLPGCYVLSRSHPDQGSKALITVHTKECEELWLKCFNALTNKEISELSGSRYSFFSEYYDFFTKHCFYPALNAFLRKNALHEIAKMHIPADPLFSEVYAELKVNGNQDMIFDAATTPKKKKRVAFFLGDPNDLGGLNRIVLQTAGVLCNYFDVWLIDTLKYNGNGYEMDDRINEMTVEWNYNKITDLLCMLQIDVLVGSYNCLEFNMLLYNEVKKAGIKVIAWSHEHYFIPYHFDVNNHLGYRLATLGNADAVIWLTNYSGGIYKLHHDNGIVIPNMVSLKKRTDAQKEKSASDNVLAKFIKKTGDEIVIIGVARFDDERKGLDKLLKAFAGIYRKNPKARLLLLGSINWNATCCMETDYLLGNKYKTYKALLKEYKVPTDAVIATGQIKEVRPYYELADLHLLASSYEGFGLVITEAACYGIPTIAFKGNGYEDIIDHGEGGYIVADVEEMIEKASEVLAEPQKLKMMGQQANKRLTRFSAECVGSKWRDLINHVVDDTPVTFKQYLTEQRKDGKVFTTEELVELVRELEMDIALRQTNTSSPAAAASLEGNATYWKQQVKNMEQTLSWKITKPLRSLRGMLKRNTDKE